MQRSPIHRGQQIVPKVDAPGACAVCDWPIEPIVDHWRHVPADDPGRVVRVASARRLADSLHRLLHEHGDLWPTCDSCRALAYAAWEDMHRDV